MKWDKIRQKKSKKKMGKMNIIIIARKDKKLLMILIRYNKEKKMKKVRLMNFRLVDLNSAKKILQFKMVKKKKLTILNKLKIIIKFNKTSYNPRVIKKNNNNSKI